MHLLKSFRARLSISLSILIVLSMFLISPKNINASWIHFLTINLADADLTLIGEENGDWTAYFVSPAGDVNGDGLGDILIGAPMAGEKICPYPLNPDGSCPGVPKGKGVAYLILGREGMDVGSSLNLANADASFIGCEMNSMTARQLYTAGDVNGDGYDDFLISGWKCGESYTGKAYLFLGRPDVDSWGHYFSVEDADASFLGENEWDFLSYYVSTAGDVNGDGYDDFLITATHHEYDEPCSPGEAENGRQCCNSYMNSVEIYDVASDTWTIINSMSADRINHTAVLLNDNVLVSGGQNCSLYLKTAEIYETSKDTWIQTGNMNAARSGHGLVALKNGKVLAAGGQNSGGILKSAELYNSSAETWQVTSNMNTARLGHAMVLLGDGKVLAAGGENTLGALNSTELYDPGAGTWSFAASMNNPRSGHTLTVLPDGKVLVAGGENSDGPLVSAELYDPDMDAWMETGSLNSARSGHAAAQLPGGDVIVVGGKDNISILDSSEIYDTSTGSWTAAPKLKEARSHHTATLLPGGKVLVTGGQNPGGSIRLHEIYDPDSGSWTLVNTQTLNTARADHITVALPQGTTLTAGGRNCTDFGKVYLILGRPEADWGSDFHLSQADASFLGEYVGDRLGRSATGVGDVNGDGYDDFLIGSISSEDNAGQNYLFLGRPSPNNSDYDPLRPWWGSDYSVAGADASFIGEAPGDESGRRVAAAGDVNGDGLDDMLMQAALNDYAGINAGITYLVLGRTEADWGMRFSLANADSSFVGESRDDQAGRRISGVGDVNNDGYDDFVIGAPHNQEGSQYPGIVAGKAYLIYGRPDVNWGLYYPLARADAAYIGKPGIGVAGYDMAGIKDFNGDGIDDFVIGAYGGRNNTHVPGEAYVILGSDKPVPVQYFAQILSIEPDLLIRYTGEYWEPNGWEDIHTVELVLESRERSEMRMHVFYDQSLGNISMYDFHVNEWLGSCTPGTSGQLINDVSLLQCKGSRFFGDENHTLRVSWLVNWIQIPENKEEFDIYLRATDLAGNDSGFIHYGVWALMPYDIFLPLIGK
jgi:N-acetylneuraminic acid mutarotase